MTKTIDGLPPLAFPIVGAAVARRLQENRSAVGDKPTAARTRLRCSDAWKCSRQIAFGSAGIPRDIPLDPKALAIFAMGDFIHQGVQEALILALDARCEVTADWSDAGLSLSGKADAVYEWKGILDPGRPHGPQPEYGDPVLVEVKSINGWGYKYAVAGYTYRDPDKEPKLAGPKVEHVVQAGLYALSPTIRSQWVHIVYVNKDSSDIAEWLLHVDQPMPHLEDRTIRSLVEWELKRGAGILGRIDGGTLPARYVPDHGAVVEPSAGKSAKTHFSCGYCAWLPTCQQLPQEAVPFAGLPENKRPSIEEEA